MTRDGRARHAASARGVCSARDGPAFRADDETAVPCRVPIPRTCRFRTGSWRASRTRSPTLIAKELGADAELHLVGTAARVHQKHDERDLEGGALRRRDRRACRLRSGSNHHALLSVDVRLRLSEGQGTRRSHLWTIRCSRNSRSACISSATTTPIPPPVHELAKTRRRRQRRRLQHVLLQRESAEHDHRCRGEREDRCRHRVGARRRILCRATSGCHWRWSPSRPDKGDLPFAFDISMGVKKGTRR